MGKEARRVIIAGGGAAGMLAAIKAGRDGHRVILLERNEKLGKKIYITGKGRCNITNDTEVESLLGAVISNPKFLYSAFYGFTSQDMMHLLEELSLPVKTERGNRVFPVSDKSSDVIRALKKEMERLGVEVHLHTRVTRIVTEAGAVAGVMCCTEEGERQQLEAFRASCGKEVFMEADVIIVATGGMSYPSTGSTGDGYVLAQETGHGLVSPLPSLVPFETKEDYVPKMQGLSLRNVGLTVSSGGRELYNGFGEMLFTHFGVSGPLVLSASSYAVPFIKKGLQLSVDIKPALSHKQLDERILRDFSEGKNSQFKNSLGKLLPAKMIPVIVELSGIKPDKLVNEVTRQEREHLVQLLKAFPMTVKSARGFAEAVITKGGVRVRDLNPGNMESKQIEGLRFAGEVLDVDALTGGYNLQIAWSTGYAAGTI